MYTFCSETNITALSSACPWGSNYDTIIDMALSVTSPETTMERTQNIEATSCIHRMGFFLLLLLFRVKRNVPNKSQDIY